MLKRTLLIGFGVMALAVMACSDDGAEPGGDGGSQGGASSTLPAGPGLTPAEALASDLEGPLLVNGFVVATGDEVRLCSALAESSPPQCGGESLAVVGLDLDTLEGTRTEGSTTWTEASTQLLGTVADGILTATALSAS